MHTEQACDPTLPEPNHAVNIELAELVSSKKANRYASSRDDAGKQNEGA